MSESSCEMCAECASRVGRTGAEEIIEIQCFYLHSDNQHSGDRFLYLKKKYIILIYTSNITQVTKKTKAELQKKMNCDKYKHRGAK